MLARASIAQATTLDTGIELTPNLDQSYGHFFSMR
jgi:hypothetical protein